MPYGRLVRSAISTRTTTTDLLYCSTNYSKCINRRHFVTAVKSCDQGNCTPKKKRDCPLIVNDTLPRPSWETKWPLGLWRRGEITVSLALKARRVWVSQSGMSTQVLLCVPTAVMLAAQGQGNPATLQLSVCWGKAICCVHLEIYHLSMCGTCVR